MKIWAVAMVRNEADVIEAFARHTLAFVDGLAIIDHRSTDATPALLAGLKAAGAPLIVVHSTEAAFYQGSEITRLAAEAFRRTDAEFVLALDADEFIRAPSRAAIEGALAALPPGTHGRLRWYSYVPRRFDLAFGPHCLERRLREERVARYKLAMRRGFVETGDFMVTEGNHWISDLRTGRAAPHEHIAPEQVALAHCPVRSRAQLSAKVRLGYEALIAAGSPSAAMAYHWRDLYEDLNRGVALDDERLATIAANYTVPREDWLPAAEAELVDDPVALRNGVAARVC